MKCIEEQCLELGIEMESLLETAAKRRQLLLDRLRGSAAQPVVDTTHEIAEKDMKEMYYNWRWDVDSRMGTDLRCNIDCLPSLSSSSSSAAQPASNIA